MSALAFMTTRATLAAAHWQTGLIHHLGDASLELCKLGVCFCLCVLTGSNFFVKVCLKRCGQFCNHFIKINALCFCHISN